MTEATNTTLAVPFVAVLQQLRQTQDEHADAAAACNAYRLLAQQALHRLAEQQSEIHRLREQHRRVVEEYRAYRAATITSGRAA